jgi:hypothetical protein
MLEFKFIMWFQENLASTTIFISAYFQIFSVGKNCARVGLTAEPLHIEDSAAGPVERLHNGTPVEY